MIQSASKYQVSDIFGIDTAVKYIIPKYQREYIWNKEQWENLFNDLDSNDGGHFLGSIICINRGDDALNITPLEVVDGQQRLATISLLYSATYDRLLKEDRSDDDFVTERINLKNRILQKGKINELKLELSYQNNNFNDYKAILNEIRLWDADKPSYLVMRRLYRAYQYFKKRLEDLCYDDIIALLKKINAALLVKIEVNDHADAFILFESLNNRGVPLSAIDLLKNKVLSKLESKSEKSLDEAFTGWKRLIDNLPDYSIQERFLRQYYNAFRYRSIFS